MWGVDEGHNPFKEEEEEKNLKKKENYDRKTYD